jgi:hypothetical protein
MDREDVLKGRDSSTLVASNAEVVALSGARFEDDANLKIVSEEELELSKKKAKRKFARSWKGRLQR